VLILDRYLLRQFLQIFAICFCSLAGLYIVIDAFGNLDDFMRFSSDEHGSLWKIMGEYYGYRTIGFFDRTSGILTLIAAMFTIAMFQRFNEVIEAPALIGIATDGLSCVGGSPHGFISLAQHHIRAHQL
jgi:lipopolysaccharide export system permease protein